MRYQLLNEYINLIKILHTIWLCTIYKAAEMNFIIRNESEHEFLRRAFNMTYVFSSSDLISILKEVL